MMPKHIEETLACCGLAHRYTFDCPRAAPIPKILRTFAAIDPVMNDPTNFKVRYVTTGYHSIFFFDNEKCMTHLSDSLDTNSFHAQQRPRYAHTHTLS